MPAGGGFHPFNGKISRHFGDSVGSFVDAAIVLDTPALAINDVFYVCLVNGAMEADKAIKLETAGT